MQLGNWIPLDKSLARELPKGRAYSKIEAMFSLSLDYDRDNSVTVAGYAERWGWNRKTVKRFLEEIGVKIFYPKSTKSMQNQQGQIKGQIRDRSRDRKGTDRGTDKGQIRFIDSKWLEERRDRKGTDRGTDKGQIEGQIRDRSRATTINPNPNPKDFIKPIQANLTSKSKPNFCSLLVKEEKPFLSIFEKCKNLDCWKSPDQDPQLRAWALEIAQGLTKLEVQERIIVTVIQERDFDRALNALSYTQQAVRGIKEGGGKVSNPTGLFIASFGRKYSTKEMEKRLSKERAKERAAENKARSAAEVLDMPKHKAKTRFREIFGAIQEHAANQKIMEK